MVQTVTNRATSPGASEFLPSILPRRLALLGGTTTLTDCLVALRYLADVRHLVRGAAITEYEQAFAKQIGVRYAYSSPTRFGDWSR